MPRNCKALIEKKKEDLKVNGGTLLFGSPCST